MGTALLIAIAVVAMVLTRSDAEISQVGAAIAGALAVVTAVISAWSAQRIVELEEDRQKPYPYPSFDMSSRYGLVLFRIENLGGGAAHDISIDWDGEPLTARGEEVRFGPTAEKSQIPVLLPGKGISKLVDGNIEFFKPGRTRSHSGTISCKDAKGRKYRHAFRMDAEMYLGTPTHSDEELKTHFELQKVPSQLGKLEKELNRIRESLEKQARKE